MNRFIARVMAHGAGLAAAAVLSMSASAQVTTTTELEVDIDYYLLNYFNQLHPLPSSTTISTSTPRAEPCAPMPSAAPEFRG
jgi:hypothetical protein